jgi:ERAP1-like C-terminal domain
VWDSILDNLSTLETLAAGAPEQPLIRRFVIDLVTPKFNTLGWNERPGEPAEERELRATLATALARAGDERAIAEGRARFGHYLVDPSSVSPSMIEFVLDVAGRHGDAATYEALMQQLVHANSSEERHRFGRALMNARDPALAARTLQLALSPQLPPHLAADVVPGVGRVHVEQAWAFAVAHREALMKDLDALEANRNFPSIVSASSNPAHAAMMEEYVRENFGADALVEAQRVGNGIRIRAAQKARLLPQVRAALGQNINQ